MIFSRGGMKLFRLVRNWHQTFEPALQIFCKFKARKPLLDARVVFYPIGGGDLPAKIRCFFPKTWLTRAREA
jgi:hypothetical protein